MAHNKIMIIDGKTVITGSFNFTKATEEKNSENLLIIKDRDLAGKYTENWKLHGGHSAAYTGKLTSQIVRNQSKSTRYHAQTKKLVITVEPSPAFPTTITAAEVYYRLCKGGSPFLLCFLTGCWRPSVSVTVETFGISARHSNSSL
jgi:phosphatidylserine/phosphatidylglycerophosphate/cardiolipin synthase-like enzyme